jgi:putative peptide maturation system protein
MRDDFGAVLQEAATLLRDLPRAYREVPEAQRRTAAWRERHPNLRADLLVDRQPGSIHVDYDVLLGDPSGGTLTLTWQGEDSLPWSVCDADHWAANFVLSVNGSDGVTVQQALLALRMSAAEHPDLLDELVHQKLLLQAIERDPPPVTAEELQEAADRFRRANGLHTAAETARWLEELGLPEDQFGGVLELTVQGRKMKQRVTAEHLEAYFEAHRDRYDQLRLLEVRVPAPELAERLAAEARGAGLLAATEAVLRDSSLPPVEGELVVRYAGTLPPPLRTASTGEIVGPHQEGRRYLVAQVYGRRAARLDNETREVVQEAVYQEWLARQRAAATVRWHWM